MNILHITNTSMAGAPVHLSKILNKYSTIKSNTVLRKTFSAEHLSRLHWDYEYINPDNKTLQSLVENADIIHYHNKPMYGGIYFKDKKDCIQFHSQPEHHKGGYRPNISYSNFNGRKLVIAQYHTRYYTDATIIPNMIDIYDQNYDNLQKDDYKVTLFFSYADTGKGWSDKGVDKIKSILDQFKDKCNVYIVNNTPYHYMMQLKAKADIVIGDCITGSYHLSDLEGLAVGAVTINNIDELCSDNIRKITGNNSNPFIKSDINNLKKTIEHYIINQDEMKDVQLKSRQWMIDNWNPKSLVKYYEEFYEKITNT